MPEVKVHNLEGKVVRSVAVPKGLEGPVNRALLWQAMKTYLGNQRQGNADTKRRGEVSGGGKKPWKQKHTGRARAGTIRSPLWRKGGIVFGPHPRDYRSGLPAGLKRQALVSSLRAKVSDEAVSVVESFEGMQPKTKVLAELLKKIDAGQGALVVVDRASPDLLRASRNLRKVIIRPAAELNCYEVLASRKLVLTAEALRQLEGLSE